MVTTATPRALTAPPVWVVLGALSLSSSSILIAIAGTPTATTTFWRCGLALVLLAPLLAWELRRHGLPDRRTLWMGSLAGVFLGADFLLWNVSIGDVGAGIATVLANLQVVMFPLVARVFTGVRLDRRFVLALPVLLVAAAAAGGVIGPVALGENPLRGTVFALTAALGYSGFLYFSRECGVRAPRHVVTPVFFATASAAALAVVFGGLTTGIQFSLGPRTWLALALVAVFGQVLGWLLVGWGLPRLAPAVSSALLLLQPIGAVLLAMVVLGEVPSVTQVAGGAVVLAVVWLLVAGKPRNSPHQG
ncbi:DMT family transporter [Amycolatopsis sp. 195334CR]|uniref:DMT family transporter n=1 Tax=Amycolatopsis sp. 195334CR TaxID=2814588 RepID=UPI001A9095C6|nr:DMT family transporter [Amycolatopsis sp. 195334CR]MBN6039739.1 DMT family transporter [Amycolatopsis sp. 195334CR]